MKPPAPDPKTRPRGPLMRRAAPDTFGSVVYAAVITLILLQFFSVVAMEIM